jgi:hypothetical protein
MNELHPFIISLKKNVSKKGKDKKKKKKSGEAGFSI